MQWSVRINEAYRRLRDPMARAAYLCELRGAAIDAEQQHRHAAEFLMQQMTWREALDDARSEPHWWHWREVRDRGKALSRQAEHATG